VPRTDVVLADPRLELALATHSRAIVRRAVAVAQEKCRQGDIAAADVVATALAALPTDMREVLNATGVVLHTNLGRAPLSVPALDAVVAAGRGYVDLELDLATGVRARRGGSVEAALLAAVPAADAALVVNNGAAALLLAVLVVAGERDVVVSRGELVEIGDGFRLTSILAAAGVQLVEVGATNRTTLADYRGAVTPTTGALLKVHPSNFRVEGFTAAVPVADLAELHVPVIVDLGSGLLRPDALLPDEPDATTALEAGAALVTFSGDKLLGGPQAGILLGRADLVERVRRHPFARAMRADKLTLAALGATVTGATTPVRSMLEATGLRARAVAVVAALRETRELDAQVVDVESAVGGGSGPGLSLPSVAISLPQAYADPLRLGTPAVVGRVHHGRLLLDLRAVPADRDDDLTAAVLAVL
jgi:L-seryl-tRNA(Ser) seleniumtransferase